MKRAAKFSLSLAGMLLAVGIICMVSGAVMGGRGETDRYFESHMKDPAWSGLWHDGIHIGGEDGIHLDSTGVDIGGEHGIHWKHRGGEPVPGTNSTSQNGALKNITAIDVDVDCADVEIREGEDCSVALDWNLNNYSMSWTVEDNELKVTSESWPNVLPNSFDMGCKVAITLPAGTVLEELDLSTNLGDIDVDASFTARTAELSTDLGDVTCRGLQAGELDAESDLGDVELHMPNGREDYSWELETSMGELYLDGEKRSGGLGDIAEHGGSGRNLLEASSSLGNVQVYFGA